MDRKQEMRAELEDALGHKVDDQTAERALSGESGGSRFGTLLSENQLLIGVTFAGFVVLGVIASLALDSWIFLVVAVLVHGLATMFVTGLSVWLATASDKPDPRTVARLEDEGGGDPEQQLNDAVHRVRSGGDRGRLTDSLRKGS
jgi:hypothetical protein